MNKTMFVFCVSVVCLTAAFWSGAALAGDEIPETAIYADMSVQSKVTYTLKDGSPATLTNGSDLVVSAQFNGNTTPQDSWKLHSLTFDAPRAKSFWIDGGYVSVGEGGITFLQNDVWVAGRSVETDRRITITADQEWKGTETDPGEALRAAIYVGATYSTFYKMGLGVSDGVTQLTLSRYLDVWFSGQNTKMGNLDLTVKAPARLRVVNRKGNPASDIDGRLGCRSLTLVGNGDALVLGGFHAACEGTQMYLTPYLDVPHFAPVLNLVDGADLAMNTTYATVGTFAIPTINVTKPVDAVSDGVSAISGPFVVAQELTTVTLAGDPTLDFTGATLTESGVAAGWNISGLGSVKFAADRYKLTGPLVLGTGTTVQFAGAMDFSPLALTGVADATLELDPGADGESVLNDLGNFVGTVRIKSGKVVLLKGEGAATVIEDGGTKVLSDDLIVTDVVRTEEEIVVGEGETLQVYGNGLTARTTVILDGGAMDFMSTDKTAASPIRVTKSSYIRSGTAGATNTIAGFVTCDITNKVSGLYVDGYGCVTFAGGMRCELPGENWYELTDYNKLKIVGGSALLTNGDYFMGGGNNAGDILLGTTTPSNHSNWGKYLGIRDGATVHFADRRNGMGAGQGRVYLKPPKDSEEYNRYKVRLEVGEGGSLELPWNGQLDAGSNQSYAEVVLSGGALTINKHAPLMLGDGGNCTGDLILKSGTLTLNAAIKHPNGDDVSRLLWYGGTIRIGKEFDSKSLFIDNSYSQAGSATLRSCCQILGDGCVLDLGDFGGATFANTVADREHAEWIGSGTLTVVGGTKCKTLVMNTFPSDVKLRLENDVKVVVPEDAKVYDSQKSKYGWRRPTGFTSTDGWLTGGDMHLDELQIADATDTCISNRIPAKAINVGTVRALEGGALDVSDFHFVADGTSFTNVTFETGATWTVGATRLVVPGTLTFGETIRIAESSRPAYAPVLATAGEALVGNPEVIKAGRRTVECVFDAVKKEVIQTFKGMALLLR